MAGYFGIGIENTKTPFNVGTLWREAQSLGAAFCFTVGHRYKRQSSDTTKAWRSIPLHQLGTLDDLWAMRTYDCMVVGIELDDRAVPIQSYRHPDRAIYLLGAEDHGLGAEARKRCHQLIVLPGSYVHNVASAGTMVMFDRYVKREASRAKVA